MSSLAALLLSSLWCLTACRIATPFWYYHIVPDRWSSQGAATLQLRDDGKVNFISPGRSPGQAGRRSGWHGHWAEVAYELHIHFHAAGATTDIRRHLVVRKTYEVGTLWGSVNGWSVMMWQLPQIDVEEDEVVLQLLPDLEEPAGTLGGQWQISEQIPQISETDQCVEH